ncbi:hypothetical protein ACTMU2_29665 [Cupriavidus basilensis]
MLAATLLAEGCCRSCAARCEREAPPPQGWLRMQRQPPRSAPSKGSSWTPRTSRFCARPGKPPSTSNRAYEAAYRAYAYPTTSWNLFYGGCAGGHRRRWRGHQFAQLLGRLPVPGVVAGGKPGPATELGYSPHGLSGWPVAAVEFGGGGSGGAALTFGAGATNCTNTSPSFTMPSL